MRRCAAVGVMLFVATLRGLSVPLPAGCDDLLDRYAAECRLPRFDLDEDGELVFLPGRAHAACAELRASLEAGCVCLAQREDRAPVPRLVGSGAPSACAETTRSALGG